MHAPLPCWRWESNDAGHSPCAQTYGASNDNRVHADAPPASVPDADELRELAAALPDALALVLAREIRQRVPERVSRGARELLDASIEYIPQVGYAVCLSRPLSSEVADFLVDFQFAFASGPCSDEDLAQAESVGAGRTDSVAMREAFAAAMAARSVETMATMSEQHERRRRGCPSGASAHAAPIPSLFFYACDKTRQFDEEYGDVAHDIGDLETSLLSDLASRLSAFAPTLGRAAALCAELDALCSLATVAHERAFVRPDITDTPGTLVIAGGRHPLQELSVGHAFVPNSIDCQRHPIKVILGPNYSGKSVYARQCALIAYMAAVGSYVPAEAATVGVFDRIMVRVCSRRGAADPRGSSTFAADLEQVSAMLRHATPRSLLLIDEFGKGTAFSDGAGLLSATLSALAAGGLHGPRASAAAAAIGADCRLATGTPAGAPQHAIAAQQRGAGDASAVVATPPQQLRAVAMAGDPADADRRRGGTSGAGTSFRPHTQPQAPHQRRRQPTRALSFGGSQTTGSTAPGPSQVTSPVGRMHAMQQRNKRMRVSGASAPLPAVFAASAGGGTDAADVQHGRGLAPSWTPPVTLVCTHFAELLEPHARPASDRVGFCRMEVVVCEGGGGADDLFGTADGACAQQQRSFAAAGTQGGVPTDGVAAFSPTPRDSVAYLYRAVPLDPSSIAAGAASLTVSSFGLLCTQSAGVLPNVVSRARQVMTLHAAGERVGRVPLRELLADAGGSNGNGAAVEEGAGTCGRRDGADSGDDGGEAAAAAASADAAADVLVASWDAAKRGAGDGARTAEDDGLVELERTWARIMRII